MNTKYTNVVLTVIAACLIFQVARSLTQKPIPVVVQTQDRPASPTGIQEFKFPSGTIDINIKSVGGDTLRRVGSQVVLPVGVENTVETKIVGPMFSGSGSGFKDGLGVFILNR